MIPRTALSAEALAFLEQKVGSTAKMGLDV